MEKNNLSIFEEERNKIVKKYENEKIFSKLLKTLLMLCIISFVSSYCMNTVTLLLKNNEQILMILKVCYLVLAILLGTLILIKSDKGVVKYCIFAVILSGGLYKDIFLQDVSDILLKLLLTAVTFTLLIINFRKFRAKFKSKETETYYVDLGYYFVLLVSSLFILLFNVKDSTFIIVLRGIVFYTFYYKLILFQTNILSCKNKCDRHTIILNATMLALCILGFIWCL